MRKGTEITEANEENEGGDATESPKPKTQNPKKLQVPSPKRFDE
jgi:hypothetical protein